MRSKSWLVTVLLAASGLSGCALSHVRSHQVDALGPYHGLGVRVLPPQGVNDAPSATQVQSGVTAGLAAGGTTLAAPEGPALIVQPRVTQLHAGSNPDGGV